MKCLEQCFPPLVFLDFTPLPFPQPIPAVCMRALVFGIHFIYMLLEPINQPTNQVIRSHGVLVKMDMEETRAKEG